MPLDPILGSIISGLFSFGGSALAGDPTQKRNSFAGSNVDPKQLLGEYWKNLNTVGGAASEKLKAGTTLRNSVAPTPPGFKVSDPASIDPSLLHFPGLDLGSIFGKPASAGPVTPLTPEDRAERRGGKLSPGLDGRIGSAGAPSAVANADQSSTFGQMMDQLLNPFSRRRGTERKSEVDDVGIDGSNR